MELTVDTNLDDLTMTVVATFDHPVGRVWDLYADPRKLERFWGPPTYPATVTTHELAPGGEVVYFMTSPEGQRHYGRWDVQQVDAEKAFSVIDTFADEHGVALEGMPVMRMDFTFETTGDGSRMQCLTTFPDLATLEQSLQMGMEEGLRGSMGQMESVLADA